MGTIIVMSCKIPRKSSASPAPASNTPLAANPVSKPADGIYPPGTEELLAIQVQYKDATLLKLEEGYTLYAKGACINCHVASNIYVHDQWQWIDIIEDMARRARITDEQKDAVTKYVLAIKAAQPKAPN